MDKTDTWCLIKLGEKWDMDIIPTCTGKKSYLFKKCYDASDMRRKNWESNLLGRNVLIF